MALRRTTISSVLSFPELSNAGLPESSLKYSRKNSAIRSARYLALMRFQKAALRTSGWHGSSKALISGDVE